MKCRSVTLLILCLAAVAARNAYSSPRLLETFPKSGGVYVPGAGAGPITFVFSEPMDPSSFVLPNNDNSNPDRSFDVTREFFPTPVVVGQHPVVAREGGRMIEITGSLIDDGGSGLPLHLRVFRDRVRSLKGEPLDRDYTITFGFCLGCLFTGDDTLRASLPSNGQFKADPVAPLSIYFNGPIDPASFLAEFRHGAGGPIVAPFAFHWDMPAPPPFDKGFLLLTVDHPPLPMSNTPYVFQSLQVFGPATTQYPAYRLFDFRISFAVTPALALPGDVNDDGVVDISDATLALQGALGLVSLTAAQRLAADVAPGSGGAGHPVGEGSVGVDDVERILQRVVGLIPDDQWP